MSRIAVIGKPIDRVDGRLKVTGGARYAAEWQIENLAYAALVTSTVSSGRIKKLDASAAKEAPGVIDVIWHDNAMQLHSQEQEKRPVVDPENGEPLSPLQNPRILFNGQPIAVVIADSFERARYAASLVKVEYADSKTFVDFETAISERHVPEEEKGSPKKQERATDYKRGDPEKALRQAEVKVEQTYSHPAEHHNAMEPHATIAVWEGHKLTLYDKTQWVDNVRDQVALAFSMSADDVRVISPFVGGAFGSALRVWPHVLIAALAARRVQCPVKLVLTRAQLYSIVGYRPQTVQKLSLAATRDARLTAIDLEGIAQTSTYEQYTESLTDVAKYCYACPNVATRYRLVSMDVNTPASMRAPGEASGTFALESAIDELAEACNIDPLEFRIRNHADRDPEKDLPWSSKSLKECYRAAGEKFGWSQRNPKPGANRDGDYLIGHGMATATWPTYQSPATVFVRVLPDGTAVVRTAASDIGPGTYTVMTQIAADTLGLPLEKVRFELGDSKLPKAPVQGGSQTVASVGSAVQGAARAMRSKLIDAATRANDSPLYGKSAEDVTIEDGRLFVSGDSSRGQSFAELVKLSGQDALEVTHGWKPDDVEEKFSIHSFGAHFVEVRIDSQLPRVSVLRVVSAFAAGRIINPKTAQSQAIGGIAGGIGMALMEQVDRDPRTGRVMNANLADYQVPVHADIGTIEVIYVDEEDKHVNPIGAKGLAELSLTGIAAAIANAVYNATGRRIRDLPIVPEKLL
jgi:xanthine dehydrogenase YagR molybdenum-binding subunit